MIGREKMRITALAIATILAVSSYTSNVARADDTGFASIHEHVRQGRLLCMATHQHFGSSQGQRDKRRALAAAVNDWRGFTAWEYGTDWASWHAAKSKAVNCTGTAGNYGCSIAARPCRRWVRPRQARRRR